MWRNTLTTGTIPTPFETRSSTRRRDSFVSMTKQSTPRLTRNGGKSSARMYWSRILRNRAPGGWMDRHHNIKENPALVNREPTICRGPRLNHTCRRGCWSAKETLDSRNPPVLNACRHLDVGTCVRVCFISAAGRFSFLRYFFRVPLNGPRMVGQSASGTTRRLFRKGGWREKQGHC